jgi:hypothetical protein
MWCTDVAYICTCWAWARIKDVSSSTIFKIKGVLLKSCGAQTWHTSAPVEREHVSRTYVHLLCLRKRGCWSHVVHRCGTRLHLLCVSTYQGRKFIYYVQGKEGCWSHVVHRRGTHLHLLCVSTNKARWWVNVLCVWYGGCRTQCVAQTWHTL